MRRAVPLASLAAAAGLVLLLAGALRAADDPPAEADRQLRELRARLEDEKRALAEIMKRRGGVLGKMEALRAQVRRSGDRIVRLGQERAIAEAESAELVTRMREAEQRLAKSRGDLARRLRARYSFGRRGLIRLWFEAKDVPELSRRRRYLDALFRHDAVRIEAYKKLLGEWSAARSSLEAKKVSIAGLESVVREQQAQMESERQALATLLRSVDEERAAHEEVLAELKSRESSLRGVLASLERKKDAEEPEPPVEGAVDFGTLAGALCSPASGPVLTAFGPKVHPRFGTVIVQNGIEIGAPEGTPVKAVAPGTVRYSDWFRGYGRMVIIDHGAGWYTLYAHLADARVRVGQQVGKGKVIGSVGDTGSMTGANLYFEIRHHQQPQDPGAWLGGCSL